MPLITNEIQLKNFVLSIVKKAMKVASDSLANELAQSVSSKTTKGSMAPVYETTWQFLNSVIIPEILVKNNKISVKIGMDYNQMKSFSQEDNYFNAHMSLNGDTSFEGKSIPQWLLTWWDEGTKGKNSPHLIDRTNYWKDVMGDRGSKDNPNYSKMFNKFKRLFEAEMRKTGILKKKIS
jgi:hypothetical protein